MKDFVQEVVTKRFTQLPNDVQDVILSDALTSVLKESMDIANLSKEKRKECNQQATLVLVGLSTTKEFKAYVVDDLRLDQSTAQTFFDTVSAHVFIPVRDTLLKAFDSSKKAVPEQSTSTDTHSDPYREQMV